MNLLHDLTRFSQRSPTDWDIEAKNEDEYILILETTAKGQLVDTMFKQAAAKIGNQREDAAEALKGKTPQEVTQFEVEKAYYSLIKTAFRDTLKYIDNLTKKDGFFMLNTHIDKVLFTRVNRNWTIKVWCSGKYEQR